MLYFEFPLKKTFIFDTLLLYKYTVKFEKENVHYLFLEEHMKTIKKKDQLILSATELFNKQGYNATGIDQIVEHANVATMTLYRNFKSKEKLIESVLLRREILYFSYLFDNEDLSIENIVVRHLNWLENYHSNGCLF